MIRIETLAAVRKPIEPPPGAIPISQAGAWFPPQPGYSTLSSWVSLGRGGAQLETFIDRGRRYTTPAAIAAFVAAQPDWNDPSQAAPLVSRRRIEPEDVDKLRTVDAALEWLVDAERTAMHKRQAGEPFTAADKLLAADVVLCLAAAVDRCHGMKFQRAWIPDAGRELLAEARRALARVRRWAGCRDGEPLLPRRIAAAWPKIADKTAGIRFGTRRRRKRRRRLFRVAQAPPLRPRQPSADDANRRPLGLWLAVDHRRTVRREGYGAAVALSALQHAALEIILAAARLDVPCPTEALRVAWQAAGIVAEPSQRSIDRMVAELRGLLAPLDVTIQPGRFLGYFLEPAPPSDDEADHAAEHVTATTTAAASAAPPPDAAAFLARAHAAAARRPRPKPAGKTITAPCRYRLAFVDVAVDVALDAKSGTATRDGFGSICLTATRLAILRTLLDAEGRFVSEQQLRPAWSTMQLSKPPSKATMIRQTRTLASELATLGLTIESNRHGRRLAALPDEQAQDEADPHGQGQSPNRPPVTNCAHAQLTEPPGT